MIPAEPDMPLLEERPRLDSPRWIRLVSRLLFPVVRYCRGRRRDQIQPLLAPLMKGACSCNTRSDLKKLLGRPQYVLAGQTCHVREHDGSEWRPERIESYATRGCRVDVWFQNDRIRQVTGFIDLSPWDVEILVRNGCAES